MDEESSLAQFRTENRSTRFLEPLWTLTGVMVGLFPGAVTIFRVSPEKEKPRQPGLLIKITQALAFS
ncbi:hypothetical protein [Mesorhizobium sp. CA4]|uniref:hypothetical protein n=1 Tax=Mesorhizobium sp. CA4 TaxID=588499 RepID=UPI001CD09AC4|nr:hypothetical protein [Mesorhizobium sp. CA4]MBZ9820860.1 hypothetical protein [Mesorhizobium sp. CA4]